MNGKENIIQRILADADSKCEYVLSDAEARAAEIIAAANQFVGDERKALEKRQELLAEEKRRNGLAAAQLAARKYRLQKKQELICECYNRALRELAQLSPDDVRQLATRLITAYAEQNEHVCIATRDEGVITQQFLDGFNMGLVLDEQRIDGDGGLLLWGEGYQKDLSLSRLVAYSRERTEAKLSAALFGDNNG